MAKNFVPCTDEVYRLEMGKDPDCLFFQKIAEQGHYAGPKTMSKQGIYVCSADGTFLGSINSNRPESVLAVLKSGLEKFSQLPPANKQGVDKAKVAANSRWENSFPADGLVLAIHSRDLPTSHDSEAERATRWNRDTAWFTQSEMLELIPENPKAGKSMALPKTFVNRLMRLHLVDTVLGQTDQFENDELSSDVNCTIKSVSKEVIEFEFDGWTTSNSTDTTHGKTPRGVRTSLSGSAKFLISENRFERFDAVAIGYRWGRTRFNGRRRGPDFNPLGFAISLATDKTPNVPGLIYAYDVDWISR